MERSPASGLSSTAHVLLGLLAIGPASGYDIKAMADRSVRFFWNLSYSQIYPELKKLTDLGLAEPESAARGDRRRTLYRITPPGRAALRDWLVEATPAAFEMRDEMLLKLFFSDAMRPQERLAHVRAMRRREAAIVEALRRIEHEAGRPGTRSGRFQVLRAGIGMHGHYEEFLAGIERELMQEVGDDSRTPGQAG